MTWPGLGRVVYVETGEGVDEHAFTGIVIAADGPWITVACANVQYAVDLRDSYWHFGRGEPDDDEAAGRYRTWLESEQP